MLFSVVIPTYNPLKYISLLVGSIKRNECIDEIEIILSDDQSDEDLNSILENNKDINIKLITNDKHHGCPGPGRQAGAEYASGKWICFADQDDYFVDEAFDKIKAFIEKEGAKDHIIGDFIMTYANSSDYIVYDASKAWTHGKFYEKSFWQKYNLCYDDLKYCEDINLSTKIGCIYSTEGITIYRYEEPIYVWNRSLDSLSGGDYFAKSMPDYVKGTMGVILDYLERNMDKEDSRTELIIKFVETLFHIYFYCQDQRIYSDVRNIIATIAVLQPMCDRFYRLTNTSVHDIVTATSNELMDLYAQTRHDDYIQIHFIEQITFKDWVKYYLA